MIAPDGTNLGDIVYEIKKLRICELGVCDNKKSILWNDVKDLTVSGQIVRVNLMLADDRTMIGITDFRDRSILIDIGRGFLDLTGRKKARTVSNIARFITSKIFDRQWNWFMEELRSNRPVSFGSFEVTSDNLRKKRIHGGYAIIELGSITGWEISNGWIYVSHLNDQGKEKVKTLGMVIGTTNLHLIASFLDTLIHQNRKPRHLS